MDDSTQSVPAAAHDPRTYSDNGTHPPGAGNARSCNGTDAPGAGNARSDNGTRAPGIGAPFPGRLAYLELSACAEAVPRSRRHVRSVLTSWDLRDMAYDAAVVTSELVTNASTASAELPFRAAVGLLVAARGGRVMVLVWDASHDWPVLRPDDDDEAVAGRGLGIVAALSTRWGWVPDGRGKIVWAMLDLKPPSPVAGHGL